MPILEAFIQEAFRLYSPIRSGVDCMVPKGGATIAGQRFPGDTVVTILHHMTFTISRNFTDVRIIFPSVCISASRFGDLDT